jgi:hypothetical protein
LQAVAEGIAHGHQANIAIGLQRLRRRTGSPAAAADQPDAQGVVAVGVHLRQGP